MSVSTEYAVLEWTKCRECDEAILEVVGEEPLCVRCAPDEPTAQSGEEP